MISATGIGWRPFIPTMSGRDVFAGRQLHTVGYHSRHEFRGQRVLVVGGGNSRYRRDRRRPGRDSYTWTWATRRAPKYLPDHIDGRALFDIATQRRHALDRG